jgi:hypothetical protein
MLELASSSQRAVVRGTLEKSVKISPYPGERYHRRFLLGGIFLEISREIERREETR